MNRKAESGFMGSMIAVMAIMTVLTVFLAVLPSAFEDRDDNEIPLYFLDTVSVVNGKIVIGTDMEAFLVKEDIKALSIIVRPIDRTETYSEMFGHSDSDKIKIKTGILVLKVEDRTLNAEYETAVWI